MPFQKAIFRAALTATTVALTATTVLVAGTASAQEVKHFRLAHDQQLNSGYSVAYDIFSTKLKELSKGTMLIDQFPGAQLGQEPQLLQLVKAGDLDFAVVSSANTSTISPQAGVMSLHYLFRSEDHNIKALGDPKVFEAVRDMIDQTTQGIHAIGLCTQGFRHMYGKKDVRKLDDIKGVKIRDRDGRHHVPGLRRADRPHALRQRLHLAADRRRRVRRERLQRLPHQQALRSRPGDFGDGTRSQ
jgi:TRAP-type C4-dicarboxylate transport system substrate-binding protein